MPDLRELISQLIRHQNSLDSLYECCSGSLLWVLPHFDVYALLGMYSLGFVITLFMLAGSFQFIPLGYAIHKSIEAAAVFSGASIARGLACTDAYPQILFCVARMIMRFEIRCACEVLR